MASIPCHCDVVIIGGGIAGASAAFHLSQQTERNIIVLERGYAGQGVSNPVSLPDHASTEIEGNSLQWAHASGSAVMSSASTIKMMTQLFAADSESFKSHHGTEGVIRYLKLANQGMLIEKKLAQQYLKDPANEFRVLGALYLAKDPVGAVELANEFKTLTECGAVDIEWWPKEKVSMMPDCPVGTEAAIWLPNDAIINSQELCKCLLQAAVATGKVRLFENCPEVTNVWTVGDHAITELSSGARIVSDHAVVATGGLFADPELVGVMKPCWSYLVSVPSTAPTESPTAVPTVSPTWSPTSSPTVDPTVFPTDSPTSVPTAVPTTLTPTAVPTVSPSASPTASPTVKPSVAPTADPTTEPTLHPTSEPTITPTAPSPMPTVSPTLMPTGPSYSPTATPTAAPTVDYCAYYSVTNTSTATQNYASCNLTICESGYLTLSGCGSGNCVGDQFIILYDSQHNMVSYSDDALGSCGKCSQLTYLVNIDGGCRNFELVEGCYGGETCHRDQP
jgi:glycine/D-amino acid oxidase-like deaminating enzyme